MRTDGFEWVERWLDVWARDMRDPDLGLELPDKSLGLMTGGVVNRELLEDWQAEVDCRAAQLISSTLDDLPALESAAVMHVKLGAVYRFFAEPWIAYRNARMKCGIRLRAHEFS